MQETIYSQKQWVDKFIYDKPLNLYDLERVDKILNAIPDGVNTILDVGPGGGYILKALKEKGFKCFGIDLSMELVKRLKDGRVCVADVSKTPFKDSEFDLVLAADLIEHVKDDFFAESISEIIRVSRKYIIINSPYKDVVEWPVSLCAKCNREFNVYGHIRSIDMKLIKHIFPRHKFDILRIDLCGGRRNVRPRFLVHAARRWGKVYSKEGALCPHCFNNSITQPPRNIFEMLCGKAVCSVFFLVDKLTPAVCKKESEICILLKKRRSENCSDEF